MLHIEKPSKALSTVGEAISHELAANMVNDFQQAYPTERIGNHIGRDILDQILAQPGCVGIRFYNALNESGKKTLVYVGIDSNEHIISKYTCINEQGKMVSEEGVAGDRTGGPETSSTGWDFWKWLIK